MNIATLVLLSVAWGASGQETGSIAGCVVDRHGGVLPGVEVTASNADRQTRAVTDETGCYVLDGLPPGAYRVSARLAGFVTGTREDVVVAAVETTEAEPFELCIAALEEIDFALPGNGSLADAWSDADVVARVRITQTVPVRSECPTRDVVHTAAIVEVFKDRERLGRRTISFVQIVGGREPSPYRPEQELIVFLDTTTRGFEQVAGPHFAFLLDGEKVLSPTRRGFPESADLLPTLRALAAKAPVFELELWPGERLFPERLDITCGLVELREAPWGYAGIIRGGTVRQGQRLSFDETRYVTVEPGTFRAKVATTLQGRVFGPIRYLSRDSYYFGQRGRKDLPIPAGTVIDYLQYRAEGACFIRLGEDVVDVDMCPQYVEGFTLLKEPVTEMWARVSAGAGRGWLKADDRCVKVIRLPR